MTNIINILMGGSLLRYLYQGLTIIYWYEPVLIMNILLAITVLFSRDPGVSLSMEYRG